MPRLLHNACLFGESPAGLGWVCNEISAYFPGIRAEKPQGDTHRQNPVDFLPFGISFRHLAPPLPAGSKRAISFEIVFRDSF